VAKLFDVAKAGRDKARIKDFTTEGEMPRQIRLTGGALEALMRLEPVCRAVGLC
jgi:hypothetical protein